MSIVTSVKCDGPVCMEEVSDAEEGELESKGWVAVNMTPIFSDDPKEFDFCCVDCAHSFLGELL